MPAASLSDYAPRLEALAQDSGLDYFPVEFEVVPPAFMMEIAVYGLPVRMPHWSFGVRYVYQLVQHRMGHSRIFEVVFPGNPGRAYLANTNAVSENTLVIAHVLGHADFAKNNLLFRRVQEQIGYHIVEQAAAHAHHIDTAIEEYGQEQVEKVLDAALALEQHIDDHKNFSRPPFVQHVEHIAVPTPGVFQQRYEQLPGERIKPPEPRRHKKAPIPPRPEYDLLWFLANYAPEMDDWERDIFLTVREESFYFHPVFSCNIMNEGWASYWHARLLREASFLPNDLYVDAMKAHSDVVSPFAADNQVAMAINPYHVGFVMWEKIIEEQGLDAARKIMAEEDDTGFVRNHLNAELAQDMGLFTYTAKRYGEIRVDEWDIDQLHEVILAPKYNFGAPRIFVSEIGVDGTLQLKHDYQSDGRGLEIDSAKRVLEYIHQVWRRPVVVHTIDGRGERETIKVS